jgi:predicted dehydrogenase
MTLRAAIVGTGRIGSTLELDAFRHKPHTHAGWYVSSPHTLLTAGSDTNPSRLAAFGEAWGITDAHLYLDYRDMLEREPLDLVSVCAYAPDRIAMAEAAIEAGARGLWLEKAVGCSVAEARRLLAQARAQLVSVVVNHPRSQDGGYREVRRLIAAGDLGPLESVHVLFSGHLLHTGTHAWDVLDAWCGPWAEVRCWPDRVAAGTTPTDVGGRVHIRFENGVDAFVSGGEKDYFIFQFDAVFRRGRVHLGNEVREVYGLAPSHRYDGFIELADEPRPLEGPGAPPLVEVLVDAVRAGTPTLASLEAAVRALALGIAIVQAGSTPGQAVTPATLDPDLYIPSV